MLWPKIKTSPQCYVILLNVLVRCVSCTPYKVQQHNTGTSRGPGISRDTKVLAALEMCTKPQGMCRKNS